MPRRPATLASLGSGGREREEAGSTAAATPHTAPAEQQQGQQQEAEQDGEDEEMGTPREQQGQGEEEDGDGEEEPPAIEDEDEEAMPFDDAEEEGEEDDEEEEEGGAGWSLEAEMIRRRDAQLLGHTVDLGHAPHHQHAASGPGAGAAQHDDEDDDDGQEGSQSRRAQQQHAHRGSSLASMEEGAVVIVASAAASSSLLLLGREPSVSLSLSATHVLPSDTTPAVAEAAAPPEVEEGQGQGQHAGVGGGGGVAGVAAALMRTLRLDGGSGSCTSSSSGSAGSGGGGGGEKKPPPATSRGKNGSRVHPQGQGQGQGRERGRGASSASTASSTSSTRSRRVLGMDEPTAVAAALVAMSAFIYSLESVNVKLLGKDVGFWTISVWRGVVGLVCCALSYLAGRRTEHTHWLGQPELRRLLALRGAMGAAAVISSFAALTNMDLADATSLMSTAPLWTAAMAVAMNKGTWSRFDSAAAVCCTIGVLLVLKPGPLFPSSAEAGPADGVAIESEIPPPSSGATAVPRNNAFGVVSAIVCAITTAAFTVMTRYVMEENTSVVSGYAMVACIILALPGMIYEQIMRRGQRLVHGVMYDLVQLLLTGLFSYAAHMAKTYAMQITRSLGVVVMRYLNILFAFVFESFLFHQRVDPLAVAGAAVIVAGCVASILAQGARGQVVSSHQKQPSLSLSSSAALAAAVIKEAELAEAAGKMAAVRLPAA